jgi:hypothetical protein
MGTIPVRVPAAFEYGQYVLDETVIKDSNYYAPEDRGDLQDSALMHSDIGNGEVVWRTPYSRRLYYNPHYNFSTDKNPNAQGLWFEVAKSQNRKDWLDQADKAVKSRI